MGLPRDWGKQTTVLEDTNKIFVCAKTQRKGAVTTPETEPKIPATVGGCPVEAGVSRVSPQGWDAGSNFCFPIFPSILFFMFFLKPLSSVVEKLFYTYMYRSNIYYIYFRKHEFLPN